MDLIDFLQYDKPMLQHDRPSVEKQLRQVRARMGMAARRCGRDPADVTLIAVSKGQPLGRIQEAVHAGITAFGENYLQELQQKVDAIHVPQVTWHFLGRLQRRKIKDLLPMITLIHGLDALGIAEEIARRATQPVQALVTVNLGGESTKSGIAPSNVPDFLCALGAFPHLQIRGLMAIPPPTDTPEGSRAYFRRLARLLREANATQSYPAPLTELSMGMSHDFEIAIEEGATMIRVGTLLFGPRADVPVSGPAPR
ncbi:MAG: YggS family pyridoxal phosphate-dependent enzyme [Deltaproteobacteria bacterium]|nr:YggS family pyridoxal phosphate-dependent enzyme [Deltaproteobacteria bacterium]